MTVAPASGVIRDRVLEIRERGTPVRITGAGTWLDAGRPVAAATTIDVASHTGIVEYVPGDLTLTARAGTSLGELARVTAAERQWLALEPFGSDAGTLGATIATGSSGPLAHAFGTPRDQTLGLEIVTGTGDVVRGGGRVVKNVAGFDLTRLFTGSWGTLGILTEITVRLRAIPAADAHLAIALPDDSASGIATLAAAARAVPADPWAMELVNGALAARLGLPAVSTLLVRLGGNPAAVAAQRDVIATLGRTLEIPSTVWTALREAEPAGAAVVRLSARPTALAEGWRALANVAEGALVHATIGRGVVRAIVPEPDGRLTTDAMHALARSPGFMAERLPATWWPSVDAVRNSRPMPDEEIGMGRTRDRLQRRIKDAYDPMHLLNPGLLGGGIA
jgi:glycolate oxidase FAD binding subunit